MKKFILMILSISVLALFFGCEEKEPEGMKEAKLDARQKIDKTILRIDNKLESLQEQLQPEIASGQTVVQTKIDMLQNIREKLMTHLEAIDTVKTENWQNLNQRIDGTLAMAKDSLDAWEAEIEEMPQPRAYP